MPRKHLFSFVILISGLVLQQSHAKNLAYGHQAPGALIPDYNCTSKEDGYYPHPDSTKCSSYILCVDQRSAYEMDCGDGLNTFGVAEQFHFVADSGPNPETAYCDEPRNARCGPGTTPPPPPTPPTTQNPNIPCDPWNCQLVGHCRNYTKCVPDSENTVTGPGHKVTIECESDLFWNPSVNPVHGGVCDYFENLNEAKQAEYKNDPDCIEPCQWFQTDKQQCSAEYTYRKEFEGATENREIILNCPTAPDGYPKLFWSNDGRDTCVKCSHAQDNNGDPCNCILN